MSDIPNESQKLINIQEKTENDKLIKRFEIEKNQQKDQDEIYILYPMRFVIVVLFILANLAISIQQNTFAPQGCFLTVIYEVPALLVTMTSLIHMLLFAPVSFPASYVIEEYGVKAGVLIAATFCIIGSWIRCLINYSFWYAVLGQVFVGFSNPFLINSINKVSALWFKPEDRPQVTTILSFCVSITGLVGLLMPGIWFHGFHLDETKGSTQEEGRKLQFNLIFVQACMITVMMTINILFFENQPQTPASASHDMHLQKTDYKSALIILAKDTSYILQCISFAFYFGCFNLLSAVISFVLRPFGLEDPIYGSILSVIPILSGIIGCIFSSIYLKKYQRFKLVIIICMIGTISSIIYFLLSLWSRQFWQLLIPDFLVGLFIVPLVPTMLEYACETSFPVGEAIVTGIHLGAGHLLGGLMGIMDIIVLGDSCYSGQDYLGNKHMKTSRERAMIFFGLMEFFFLMGLVFIFFTKEDLKRLKFEHKQKNQSEIEMNKQ